MNNISEPDRTIYVGMHIINKIIIIWYFIDIIKK